MRLSTRLLGNAATTYWRLGTTFAIGVFTTWYILGAAGVTGFGLLALAVSSVSPSRALERALRFGLVRELADALASGEPAAVQRNVSSTLRLCLQASVPLLAVTFGVAGAAWLGAFRTPADQPRLEVALAALILAEGFHAAVRLLAAPLLQSIFAGQRVALDNALLVLGRASYALSALWVFGWWLPDAPLATQLLGFAATRVTLQLADVALGLRLAKREHPTLRLDLSAFDEDEYRSVRRTVWQSSQVTLLLNIQPQLLAVLINLFFGLTYNTIWHVVVQFSGYAWMIAEGLLRGFGPLVTHLQRGGRHGAAVELMSRSIRYQFVVALPAAVFLAVWVHPLLDLWVGGRWAVDPNLAQSTLSVTQALDLASRMAIVLVLMNALRAGFFAVERGLYGLGKVHSYSWFARWSTAIAVGGGALLMATTENPMAAPLVLLLSMALYSPCVVLLAARRELGLRLGPTLARALPRPVAAALIFLACQLLVRQQIETLTLSGLLLVLALASVSFLLPVLALAPEPDERRRLLQMLRHAPQWLARRLGSRKATDPKEGTVGRDGSADQPARRADERSATRR